MPAPNQVPLAYQEAIKADHADGNTTAHSDDNDHKDNFSAAGKDEKRVGSTIDTDDESVNVNPLVKESHGGVVRIEALHIVFGKGWKMYMLYASIAIMTYGYSLSSNTTYVYEPFATSSFSEHAIVGTISVVTSLAAGIAKPFIAKFADLTSRPTAFAVGLAFYCVGFILIASSNTVGTVVGGMLLSVVGTTSFDILTTILLGDITSLQWRGMAYSLASAPYIVNAFVAGYISQAVSLENWRWGYGMFIIIMPVTLAPTLVVLYWGDWKAKKLGALSIAAGGHAQEQHLAAEAEKDHRNFFQLALHYWSLIDAFGLLLLGFGFALILLPFTLYTGANKGFSNPSLIAMFVVGALSLTGFMLWEVWFAAHPIQPRIVLNRTFIACCVIDFFYYCSSYVGDTYFSSWVYIVKDWSTRDYNFYLNCVGVGLCVFAFIGAGLQRYFHRYKYIQLSGLCIRIIGQSLKYYAAKSNPSDAVLVMAQILCGLGGSFSVIGSQVASQGSVPHAYMSQAIGLLALWTSVGGGVGSAISAALWNKKLPANLELYLGAYYNSTELADIYGSIVVAKLAEPRDQVLIAYNKTMTDLLLPSVILCFVPLAAGLWTENFYLGDNHNNIEKKKKVVLKDEEETSEEAIRAKAAEAEAKARQD